ncbi:hypothetical protein LINGRAHAP2_LOCUS1138, partial [Linum grandiflorum]
QKPNPSLLPACAVQVATCNNPTPACLSPSTGLRSPAASAGRRPPPTPGQIPKAATSANLQRCLSHLYLQITMNSEVQPKKKAKTTLLTSYFVPVAVRNQSNVNEEVEVEAPTPPLPVNPSSSVNEVERDPGKRIKVCEWPLELRDEVRRKYLVLGAYHPKLPR